MGNGMGFGIFGMLGLDRREWITCALLATLSGSGKHRTSAKAGYGSLCEPILPATHSAEAHDTAIWAI
ncbi:hypothetical protein BC938DRAFT_483291 [Jimgerdemannia flammicorona]|uniref:Uncharacterized protein n=1 Tax=Jimgerdemannia flammicorona TaxID=994334 RepID=A0A433QCE6_9FUNG|nr:hypothetical protein BC938DRAFT_483291 [Jimgerdemannia flammicorona]